MANKKEAPTNIVDAYINYAVNEQIKAADVPPRKRLDINFSNASKVGNTKSKTNQEAYEKSSDQLYEDKPRNSISWRRYVVYMILITMLSCCFTYSKYMSAANVVSTVTVSKFNVESIGSLDGKAFTITPSLNSSDKRNITINQNDETDQQVIIKVKSTSEVKVKVTVTQTNNKFGNRFYNNSNTFYIEKTDGKNAKEGTVTFLFNPSTINVAELTTGSDGKYDVGDLNFNVIIEQVN